LLSKNKYHKGFYQHLIAEFGQREADSLWQEMDALNDELMAAHPEIEPKRADMVVPLAAFYKVLRKHYPKAEEKAEETLTESLADFTDDVTMRLLIAYGTEYGNRIGNFLHGLTSIPGVSGLVWKKMPAIMHKMGGEEAGYKSEFLSETDELCAMNVLSCPLDEALKSLDAEEACLAICAMDKVYLSRLKHIRYTRTTSVAEGAPYCDYRLKYDKTKR